jgi:hypothetical protein
MTKRPEGDLGSMAISKAKAAETVPFSATAAPIAPAPAAEDKSLTVKLKGSRYAALRAYCMEHEQSTGKKLSHQEVMVMALDDYLAKPR